MLNDIGPAIHHVPNGVNLWDGDSLGIVVKNCTEMTKSTFLGRTCGLLTNLWG